MIARHQSGASGRPCRGGFPEPGEKPAQDACSSPRGGALTGGGTGRGNQARHGSIPGQPGRTEEVIQPNWTLVVQAVEPDSTDRHAGCDAQKLNSKYISVSLSVLLQ